jgi:ubiquinone/menaquinone biosynthesis C-methylase UbiE
LKEWEDLSDWYDKKQGEAGDLWHRELIDPVLLRVIGNCRGLSVLDLACGNGYISRRLARSGAKVTALDSSPKMVKNARAHDPKNSLKIRYIVSEATRMAGIPDGSLDLVFANMSLMDIEDAEGAVAEVSRVLKKGGRFVASIPHPCFLVESNSGWVMEKNAFEPPKVYRKVRAYRKLFSEKVPWRVGETERRFTREFHRPLSWYARVLSSSGMAITALEEPEPTKEFLEKEAEKEGDLDSKGFLEVPLHLVIEATKL